MAALQKLTAQPLSTQQQRFLQRRLRHIVQLQYCSYLCTLRRILPSLREAMRNIERRQYSVDDTELKRCPLSSPLHTITTTVPTVCTVEPTVYTGSKETGGGGYIPNYPFPLPHPTPLPLPPPPRARGHRSGQGFYSPITNPTRHATIPTHPPPSPPTNHFGGGGGG